MKNIFKKSLYLAPVAFTPLVALSCGVDKNTEEKNKQVILFDKPAVSTIAENLWLKSVLQDQYKVEKDTNLLSNEKFFNEALIAYKGFLATETQKNNLYLATQLNKWKSNGIFNETELAALNALYRDVYNINLTNEQFQILYNNENTNVAFTVNKLLLVKNYFFISDVVVLEKIDPSSFNLYGKKYDNKQFNLIKYVISNKTVQLWNYTNDNVNEMYTDANKVIKHVLDYNNLLKNSKEAQNIATADLIFNNVPAKAEFEATMGGYQGIKSNPYKSDYTVDELLKVTSPENLVGFYNLTNGKLVSIDENGQLAEPIPVSKDGKKVEVAYFAKIVPVAKKITVDASENGTKEEKTVLSFDQTIYKDSLDKLAIFISISDENLYKNAKAAYITMGYKISSIDELKDKTAGLK
ncbi:HinT-interacting membrane complex lipoprotein P60 [Mycoplasma sp. 21DD0573]|uniref:HinT-interacting membrane complex lipoprotein P60 n=1 Tax=unclassified Mycoplasma TaxID=2683645 RepID=UPI002B1D4D6D|nr:hypothetical protein [Mycoplasma sp. 21DD0573]MEA4276615.1 hypothetical protein [Mycoplasma sp. 21DD0573]